MTRLHIPNKKKSSNIPPRKPPYEICVMHFPSNAFTYSLSRRNFLPNTLFSVLLPQCYNFHTHIQNKQADA